MLEIIVEKAVNRRILPTCAPTTCDDPVVYCVRRNCEKYKHLVEANSRGFFSHNVLHTVRLLRGKLNTLHLTKCERRALKLRERERERDRERERERERETERERAKIRLHALCSLILLHAVCKIYLFPHLSQKK